MSLLHTIRQFAVNEPDRTAFIHQNKQLTYGQLWHQSDQLAAYIVNRGGQSHAPVIVYGHMEPEMIISFLGCVKAGRPYIPVDTSIPMERIYKIMESAEPEFILVQDETLCEQFSGVSATVMHTNVAIGQALDIPSDALWVKSDDTFYIIYTSGSTGNPKGVQISMNNLQSFTDWMLQDFPIKERQTFLCQAPFSFDLSVMDLFPSLCTGGTLFAVSKEMLANPKELFNQLAESGIHVWTSTPSFAQLCLMEPGFNEEMLPSLETFLFCGEILPVKIVQQLMERFPQARIFNLYGPTEATVAVTMLEITDEIASAHGVLPIGICKNDSRLIIADDSGNPVTEGEKGELIIVGPSVSKGYLGEDALTKKAFTIINNQRAYKTGDAGYQKDGILYYAGRLDYQVKLHGYRIEIEEIEHNISTTQYVETCVVEPVYKENKVDYLTAYVVPKENPFTKDYLLTGAIRKELAQLLPAYMVPRKFIYLENLPMTSNSKVDRKKLAAGVLV